MNEPLATTAPPLQRPRGMGCFARGCLTLLVLVAVLLAGSVALYHLWLGPRLHAAVARFEVEHPALAAIASLAGGAGGPISAVTTGREPGSTDKNLVPPDVALLGDADAEAFSIGGDKVTAYQRAQGKLPEVRALLERRMRASLWAAEPPQEGRDTVRLRFSKEDRHCSFELVERPPEVLTYVRCDRMPGQSLAPGSAPAPSRSPGIRSPATTGG